MCVFNEEKETKETEERDELDEEKTALRTNE
jgi:hypothetical protein